MYKLKGSHCSIAPDRGPTYYKVEVFLIFLHESLVAFVYLLAVMFVEFARRPSRCSSTSRFLLCVVVRD